jgi:hypothetical protein
MHEKLAKQWEWRLALSKTIAGFNQSQYGRPRAIGGL